jgi:hypothetical protein
MKTHLNRLSSVTAYLLLQQTDQKRKTVKTSAKKLYAALKNRLEAKFKEQPKKYAAEHRLTDNYTRLLACYELIFGEDPDFRQFIYEELLRRFASAKSNQKENALINQLIFLSSSGRLKESWHYHYSNKQKELYINLTQCYQSYEQYKREKSLSLSQFREILKDYFSANGGFAKKTKRWYGKYYNSDHNVIHVDKPQHSYILSYKQLQRPDNQLKELFPPKDEHREVLRRMGRSEGDNGNKTDEINLAEEAPF